MIVILILTSTDESARSHLSTNHSPDWGQVRRDGPIRGQTEEVWSNTGTAIFTVSLITSCERKLLLFLIISVNKLPGPSTQLEIIMRLLFLSNLSLSLSLRVRARKKDISEYETEPTGEIICLLTSPSQDKNRMIIIDQRQELSVDCRCWPVSLYSSHQVIRIKWRQLR